MAIGAEKFLNQDSSISSRTFDERGASGQITINANDSTIDGGDVNSGTLGHGTAGSISIVADRMILKNQGSIGSSWEFIAFADPRGKRDRIATGVPIDRSDVEKIIGIDIEFIEEELVIDYQYFLSPDGRVFVIDVFQGDLTLMLLPLGAGDAGDVFVSVKNLTIDGGFVQTESAASGGGRIVIEATDLIDLVGADVNSNGLLPEEGDSVISLRAPRIAVNASRVTSLTRDGEPLLGSGEARILGEATAISADSEVAASSTVEIRGQETDLGSQLIALEGTVVDTAPLRERCSVRRDVGASSFTNVGRGGLPPSPDAPLRSAYSGAPAVPAAAQPSMLHVAGCAGAP